MTHLNVVSLPLNILNVTRHPCLFSMQGSINMQMSPASTHSLRDLLVDDHTLI